MAQVALGPGDEIVHRQHVPSLGEQPVAKMRPQKSRPARHHRTHAASSQIQLDSVALALANIQTPEPRGTLDSGLIAVSPNLRSTDPSTTSFPDLDQSTARRDARLIQAFVC